MNSVVIPIPGPVSRVLSYIVRHWRGQLTLGVSYWVNFTIPRAVDYVLDKAGFFGPGSTHPVAGMVIGGIELIWLPWALVGIWRAANPPTGWAFVARCIVVWQVILNGYTFIHAFLQGWNGA